MMSRNGESEELTNIDEIKEDLLPEHTLEGRWENVVKIYNKYQSAHTRVIKDSIGTALHVAVDMYEEQVVADLVKAIIDQGDVGHAQSALRMTNEHGDTPLHLAASRGFARICEYIIGEKKERLNLLSCRNEQGETPLFLAAIHWQKQAFAYLSDISKGYITLFDLIRNDGDTILHCAIQREYFDLAVIIVHHYDYLSIQSNDEKSTPLKVLASRPSAFWSATELTWWKQILYHCIPVESLEVDRTMESMLRKMRQKPADSNEIKYPDNYATCYDITVLVRTVRDIIIGKAKGDKTKHDTEDPSKKDNVYEYGFLPPNYDTSHQFVRPAFVHVLGVIGMGVKAVMKVKQKHKWSRQLLEALMKRPYAAITVTGGQPKLTTDEESWGVQQDDMVSVYQRWKQGNDNSITESPEPLLLNARIKGTETVVGETSGMGTATLMPQAEKDPKDKEKNKGTKPDEKETAFLVAARNGIVEMVDEILFKIPSAIHDINSQKENVLLVAVRNRQPLIVKALKMRLKPEFWNNLFLGVDKSENTVLHLAACALSEDKLWQISGKAMQMMWDIKWFEYIKRLLPEHFYLRSNKDGQTAGEIFIESHANLVTESGKWFEKTSESFSAVAVLVIGVSFGAASTVPGGNKETGKPALEGQPALEAFAFASLIGLCFSVTGLIMFLSVLTSRKEAQDFHRDLPLKLLLGLTCVVVSIFAMFVSFCSGQFFVLQDKFKHLLFPIYVATCAPVTIYAVGHFPLFFDLLMVIFSKVPRRRDKGLNL